MVFRVEIHPKSEITGSNARGEALLARIKRDFPVRQIRVADIYTVDKAFNDNEMQAIAESLNNEVTHEALVRREGDSQYPYTGCDWAVEIGFLPGVTDNVAHTAREIIEDKLGQPFTGEENVYSSQLLFLDTSMDREEVLRFAYRLSNPLIQRVHIKDAQALKDEHGMSFIVPRVKLDEDQTATEVNLKVSDEQLETIGQKGIPNPDGTYRGPLGLGLAEMQAIRDYFYEVEKRHPRDIEIETLAQTWSEHCKHTIFASPIDEVKDGIFKHFIRRATVDIRERKGNQDICVSVFTDNSGAIRFDEGWLITDKVETHNSPSALDPFGGAITGIVGVNRDTLGFGLGAKPVLNRYGFCFADPKSKPDLYRAPNQSQPMLSPEVIMEGVVHGVNVGGNCSGIPTPQGFAYFDERYSGKPLVYVGTVGLVPEEINGKPSHIKGAQPGDAIVMLGGRVGKDGIHGATFSSVALDEGSPSTAVQIGDPITQKKFSDAIIREAREKHLYNAITDNGAGGLSSSVGEMAEGSGGFEIELDKVPLKYPGMSPWEIWISESQERMTLAIPPANVDAFIALMAKRGCEATVVGTFTDTGRACIRWQGEAIMDVTMAFLHDGNPVHHLKTQRPEVSLSEPALPAKSVSETLPAMLSRLNICSKEFIATQYDHEVQASSVLKPLQGKGRVFAEATVSRPLLSSNKGVVTSQGLAPRYSDIDTYAMAAASIDMAVRAAIATGGSLDQLALCDNFCWCDSTNPERLWQLKRAAQACYDIAVAYGTPYISGKDSMFNDFKGYDGDSNPVKISVPPTLLVSALGVVDDIHQAVSLDAKFTGDRIYVIGTTKNELGGSEYYAMQNELGANVPQLDVTKAESTYRLYEEAVKAGEIASAIPVGFGGLGVAIAKMLIAGRLGGRADLTAAPHDASITSDEQLLYSESLGRMVVTIAPNKAAEFEARMQAIDCALVGEVTDSNTLSLNGLSGSLGDFAIDTLEDAYKAPLKDY